MVKRIYRLALKDKGRFYTKSLLVLLTSLAFFRLLGFMIAYGEKSFQLDFAAFYTAGESVNADLSPYKNYVSTNPEIWDGFSTYKHSRFLYPPLVAEFFRLFTLLPYHTAKYIWIYLTFVLLIISAFLAFQAAGIKLNVKSGLLVLLLFFIFHPVVKHLERGQINGITLFLVIWGISLICNKGNGWFAGILFAFAVLLKLHNVLILPFIILSRQWRVLGGFATGSIIILILTLLFSGPNLTISYITEELPRITAYGEGGTEEMRLDESVISSLHLDKGITKKDGRIYTFSRKGFTWAEHATLVQTPVGDFLQILFSKFKLHSSQSIASIIIFLTFFAFISFKVLRRKSKIILSQYHEFLFWQLALLLILLSAPLTWDSNTVWLIPLFPVLVSGRLIFQTSMERFSFILIVIGLLIIGVPNFTPYPYIVPFKFLNDIRKFQYVFGELIVFAGLVIFLFHTSRQYSNLNGVNYEYPALKHLDMNLETGGRENEILDEVKTV